METASWFSITNVLLLLAGVAIGALAGHFTSPAIGEAKRLRSDLDRVLHEQETYKASVNSHFRKTAELVGQMTKSYAAVYDHLAGGARTFCDDSGPEQKLPFEPLPGQLATPAIETGAEPVRASDAATDAAADAADAATETLDETVSETIAETSLSEMVMDETGAGPTIVEPTTSLDSRSHTTSSSS